MIVRVLGEGQYEVSDDLMEQLGELDEKAIGALEQEDETALTALVAKMGELVRSMGERIADDRLVSSEIVVPDSDSTLEELRGLRDEDGFIPDPPAAQKSPR